ncbi:MAG: hypothetical protein KC635_19120 [Myxococcales bacterium]|nr:hypothetical protein [Myxococcales bacterium]MCB9732908.1 hypothetical protein [Deltaproteobacteria bacterium]
MRWRPGEALPAYVLVVGLLATALGACVEDLPRANFVEDTRVLAIVAEPPQVEPGDTVHLTALIANPKARPLRLAWSVCLVPEQGRGFFGSGSETSTSGGNGAGLDAQPACATLAADGVEYAADLGEGLEKDFTVPADLFDTDRPLQITYGLPEDVALSETEKTGFLGIAGVNYTVQLLVTTDVETIDARKRVNVGVESLLSDNPSNENPVDLAFHIAPKDDGVDPPLTAEAPADGSCFIAGSAASVTAGTTYRVTPLNIPSPQETYAVLLTGSSADEAFTVQYTEETYFYSFFSTVAGLDKDVSKSSNSAHTDWKVPEDASGVADFWVVVRDGRGGAAWCESHLPIVAP